jgi:hypothetical protein
MTNIIDFEAWRSGRRLAPRPSAGVVDLFAVAPGLVGLDASFAEHVAFDVFVAAAAHGGRLNLFQNEAGGSALVFGEVPRAAVADVLKPVVAAGALIRDAEGVGAA